MRAAESWTGRLARYGLAALFTNHGHNAKSFVAASTRCLIPLRSTFKWIGTRARFDSRADQDRSGSSECGRPRSGPAAGRYHGAVPASRPCRLTTGGAAARLSADLCPSRPAGCSLCVPRVSAWARTEPQPGPSPSVSAAASELCQPCQALPLTVSLAGRLGLGALHRAQTARRLQVPLCRRRRPRPPRACVLSTSVGRRARASCKRSARSCLGAPSMV